MTSCALFLQPASRLREMIFAFIFSLILTTAGAQVYNSASVFAHNDYVRPRPFHTAYELQVGFIEADVFLQDGDLLVAHHRYEIEKGKTLENLYLKPLLQQIRKNMGSAYADPAQTLVLMIDLKTEGVSTLNKLVSILEKYPDLLGCSTFSCMVSGNVPDPESWNNYPRFINFDGRPGISYSSEQLQRIKMISTSFRDHSTWNGKGQLPESDQKKIRALVKEVHEKGKPIRFWASPDFTEAWKEFIRIKLDVLVTDDVVGLTTFLNSQRK